MEVGIIGLGLIGGSMAVDLRHRGFVDEADLVVLAVPVGTAVKMLPQVLDRFAELRMAEGTTGEISSEEQKICGNASSGGASLRDLGAARICGRRS